MVCQLVRSISSDSCYNCTLYFQKGYLIIEEILRISCICRSTCPGLRVAFAAIIEHATHEGFALQRLAHSIKETNPWMDQISLPLQSPGLMAKPLGTLS